MLRIYYFLVKRTQLFGQPNINRCTFSFNADSAFLFDTHADELFFCQLAAMTRALPLTLPFEHFSI